MVECLIVFSWMQQLSHEHNTFRTYEFSIYLCWHSSTSLKSLKRAPFKNSATAVYMHSFRSQLGICSSMFHHCCSNASALYFSLHGIIHWHHTARWGNQWNSSFSGLSNKVPTGSVHTVVRPAHHYQCWRMQWSQVKNAVASAPQRKHVRYLLDSNAHPFCTARNDKCNVLDCPLTSFMAIKAIFPDLKKTKKPWIRVIVDWATLSAVVGGLLITINSPDHLICSAVCGIWKTTFLKMPCRPCTQWNFRSGHKAITTSTTMREFDGITIFVC